MPPDLEHELSSILTDISSSVPAASSVNQLVGLCHQLATAFVKSKLGNGQLNLSLVSMEPHDIAYDCIAELFERNATGELPELKAYFEAVDLDSMSEKWLLAHLRRLVFSKVNDGLYRLYNEVDPVYGKILRNIKLAVATLVTFQECDRFGESCLVPTGCETLEHLPPMDRDFLEGHLRDVACVKDHVPAILAKLSRLLRDQSDWCRIVPLLAVATAIRSIYVSGYRVEVEENRIPQDLMQQDIRGVINDAISESKAAYYDRYVRSGKVRAADYDDYFTVLERGLIMKAVEGDGEGFSYLEEMSRLQPDLTEGVYRDRHKNRLEYLGRIVNLRIAEALRR